jgi:two-component system OmpR family sensor kinase
MPLRLRLGLVFAVATAAIIAIVGVGFVLQLRSSLNATLDASLRGRADSLSDQYDAGGTAALRLNQDEEPVQILTMDGRVVASSPALGAIPVLDTGARQDVGARAAAGQAPLVFTAGDEEDRTRYLAVVLSRPDGLILVVGTGTDTADTADDRVETAILVLGPPAVLAAGIGAWWLAGAALRPVERMRRQTAEMSEHDDGAHLAVPSTRDEIAALARTMNDLLDRLRGALAHERGFVADAGHELRTPLATLRAELELAARPGRTHADLRAAVAAAGDETERLIRLAEDLLLLARAEGEPSFVRTDVVDLGRIAALAARAAAAVADPRGVDVVVDGPERVAVRGDPDRLRQAVDNVLANAVRHAPDHGLVAITLTADDRDVTVSIADDGPGFPPDFLPHAFERFRRADTARTRADGGSGLGLAIVETIIGAHHGVARAANRPGGGAVVDLVLPVHLDGEDRDGTAHGVAVVPALDR